MEELTQIEKRLAHIESLLQRLPEILVAVHFSMLTDYENAKFRGQSTENLWGVIPPPSSR